MEFPKFGKNQNQFKQQYQDEQAPPSKRKMYLLIGGGILVVILLLLVVFAGGDKAGQPEMKRSLQSISDSIGSIDEYSKELQFAPSQNDVALIQILLRGNYQKLNELYVETYGAKKFSGNPKPDKADVEVLSAAVRNDTIDSELIEILGPKVTTARKNLSLAKKGFTQKDSLATINNIIEDLASIEEIINRSR